MAKTGAKGLIHAFANAATLTNEEYAARINAINKLVGALDTLVDAVAAIGPAVEKMTDSLASALAGSAHAFGKEIGDGDRYYIDDIWEALGRYAYATGDSSFEATEPLLSLTYALAQCHKKVAAARQTVDDAAMVAAVEARGYETTAFEQEQPPTPIH